jgi:hypothetical protein
MIACQIVYAHDFAISSATTLPVHGIQGNPLAADSFETLVDISEYVCAMCLCDSQWIDPDADGCNGADFLEETDMLRLDSMLFLTQLHIRYALKAQVCYCTIMP